MKAIDWLATTLVVVGALNWGLVGIFNFNLVTALLGPNALASAVFALVGAAGLYFVARWATSQKQLGAVPA
jgi:uncharacterized membrane protein YuzA (DUF378 family)